MTGCNLASKGGNVNEWKRSIFIGGYPQLWMMVDGRWEEISWQ